MEKLTTKYNRVITAPAIKRIVGIDQLRYVFALWVFFFHNGAPPLFSGHAQTPAFDFLTKFYGWSINGQASVIGFFIISGLCIHYPNIRRESINLKSFYTARFLRLSLPLFGVLIIGKVVNYHYYNDFLHVVPIWTLYCEAIYYLVYPLVLFTIKRGWFVHFILFSGLISLILIVIWSEDRSMYFHEIGGGGILSWKAAVLALPCWLLGVLIGERISDKELVDKKLKSNGSLLYWRLGALLLSMITFPLYRIGFYLNVIKQPFVGLIFTSQFTLLLYGIYAFFWIEKEVIYNNFGKPSINRWLEKFGLASYTLYLVHILVLWFFQKIDAKYFPGYLAFWLALVCFLHVAMYVFYNVVEKPTHKIAKFCASVFKTN